MSGFQMSYANPEVWVSRRLSVMTPFALRSFGRPSAVQPSMTGTSPSAGSTSAAGASRESLPCSTNCIAATPVSGLVIDAIHITVSVVMAAPLPSSRSPKADA